MGMLVLHKKKLHDLIVIASNCINEMKNLVLDVIRACMLCQSDVCMLALT